MGRGDRRNRHSTKAAWLTGGLLFLLASGLVGLLGEGEGLGTQQASLARIDVEGPILGSDPLVELLGEAREKEDVKGVLLRVSSPGGGVGASQAVYEAVRRLSEEKPVAVAMGDVAASGGYMVALGGDRVFALDSTLTGSIGVIMMSTGIYPVLERIGVEPRIIKSGELKDAGTPLREMDERDRAYLQSVVDALHAQFVELVAQEQDLSEDRVRQLADGRVYTGRQASQNGLVDQLGGHPAAEEWLREESGVGPEAQVKELKPAPDWWQALTTEALVRWYQWLVTPGPRYLYQSPELP